MQVVGNGSYPLGEEDCKASKLCAPMYAFDQPSQICANTSPLSKLYAGCMSADIGCGAALTCAVKEGAKASFPSTCLGEGWKGLNYGECCPSGG